ncbi:cortical protein marker for cell polarity-domain-containing protein [Kickxella alabastrina]|uniref:cortical protein marker for cell polarity-domain-containing protein n=1 Tax=Kickxella alabastrina TaxID=61397 RepID=UPI0022207754|nr:cortical protein marker for cell polarity-domain-containing protein [Kickxella alabastrina]KAI7829170.1 cortical protein marker for cell polarity-domain-containing protein [Kickxella alabastrina]
MNGGVDGPINALYCDQGTQQVFVGGSFTSTVEGMTSSIVTMRSSSTGGIAVYNATAKAWKQLPFHGVDGPVHDFAQMQGNVFAVGEFSSTNDNATYVSLATQPMDLGAFDIVGGNSGEILGFNNPFNVICTNKADTADNTWLMRDKLTGFFKINFPFKATPSLLRIMNTAYEGRGTKSFRVEAAENNQALTMSYIDPESRIEQFCTQSCPLEQNYNWQEFRFVDDDVMLANITGVTINIVDWYGMGGGFNKIELYQRDPRIYSVDTFNGSPCSTMPLKPSSKFTGNWIKTTPASYHGTYMTLTVNVADVASATTQSSVLLLAPYIPEAGFYRVYMMIPGCQNTNTCQQRSSAQVLINMNSKESKRFNVGQYNHDDDESIVATIYAPESTSQFSVTVQVSLDPNGAVNPQATTVELVVDSFRFERITSYDNLNGVIVVSPDFDSYKQLEGPLYGPLNDTLPNNSVVYSVASGKSNDADSADVLFLGGKFMGANADYYGITQYRDNAIKPLDRMGLWGTVSSMAFVGTSLFVGGAFNGTADFGVSLGNMAQYNTTDQHWYQLNGGADGPVTSVVPYSPFGPSVVAFSGKFNNLPSRPGTTSATIATTGLAMWDASTSQWASMPYIKNTPTLLFADSWQDRQSNVALVAGSLTAVAALEANGAVLLSSDGGIKSLDTLGANLLPDPQGRLLVNSGLWYAKNNMTTSMLIVGGQFHTPDGATNVAKLQNGKWQRLMDDINGEVLTINNAANILFVGGVANVSQSASGKGAGGFSGLVAYYMDKDETMGIQSLQGPANSAPSDVRINKVAIRADTSMVVVGGNFTTAGGLLSCPYVCTLDINESQWSPLVPSTLIDQVTDMLFVDSKLVVAGMFKNGTAPTTYLMAYDFEINNWANITGADKLPGPVTTLTSADHEDSPGMYYIIGTEALSGAPYLAKYDGLTIINADFTIEPQSTIRSVLLVPLSRIPSSVLGSKSTLGRRSDMTIPSGYVLAVSGDLHLPSGRRASNAFFYDNKWAEFLSTIQSDGSPGFIGSTFFEIPPTNVYQRNRLSVALVILIAIAIALGITFLIVLIGLVYIYMRNRREAAATASAASAALAATVGGAGGAGTNKILGAGTLAGGTGVSDYRPNAGGSVSVAAAGALAGGALAMGTKRNTQNEKQRNIAGNRDTWGENMFAGEPVSYNNVASNTLRLNSDSPAGLAGLAVAGRQAAVSSETYVNHDDKKQRETKFAQKEDPNESLVSIFESIAAEAEAEAEAEVQKARERAASESSMEGAMASIGPGAAGVGVNAAATGYHMPIARHYDNDVNMLSGDSGSESNQYSRTSMYRPDSTNPFEQRMAMRESQGPFPPAGPFTDTDDGLGHIPMPRAYRMDDEHYTAAALAGASPAAAGLAAAYSGKTDAKNNRYRSETTSTRNTDAAASVSQTPSSRPSGESSAESSSGHLPIRDSLKQYPVFYAKFTFSSRETGELGFRAGERVFVIDQSDEIWWMGIVDHGADQPLEQGVFPATYVSSEPPKSTDWSELM